MFHHQQMWIVVPSIFIVFVVICYSRSKIVGLDGVGGNKTCILFICYVNLPLVLLDYGLVSCHYIC